MKNRRALALLPLAYLVAACDEKPETPAPDTTPPQVLITAPVDSATLVGVDSIRIAATDDEGVVRVAAYLDADSLGEDLTAPYVIAVNPQRVDADTFALSARAWDAAGNRGDSPGITAFVLDAALEITQPAADAVVSGTVAVRIEAVLPELVAEVALLVDGVQVGAAGQTPLVVSWDTAPWSDGGPHLLQAVGHVGEVPVVSAPLSVRVAPGVQAIPAILAPEADGIEIFELVTFRWTREPHALEYEFQLSPESDFWPLYYNEPVADTVLIRAVPGLGRRYARVRAGFGGLGWSAWSPVRRFQQQSPLEDGIWTLQVATTGNAIALAADGDLLLAGQLTPDAIAFGLDGEGAPSFLRTYAFPPSVSSAFSCAFPRSLGGWTLCARQVNNPYAAVVLDVAADGQELARRPFDLGAAHWPAGLLELPDGTTAVLVTLCCGGSSASVMSLTGDGAIDWVTRWNGYEDVGNGWSSSLDHQGVALLLPSVTQLITVGYTRWVYWSEWGDGDFQANAWVRALVPGTGEVQQELFLDSVELTAACLRGDEGIEAVGFDEDRSPTLFHVRSGIGSFDAVPLLIEPWTTGALTAIEALPGGDFAIAGRRGDNGIVLRAAEDGAVLWLREYGEAGPADIFNDLAVLETGEILAIGTTESYGYAEHSLWIKRFDGAGNDITSERMP